MLSRRIMLDWGLADATPQSRMHALRQCTFDNFLHMSVFLSPPPRLTRLVGAICDCGLTLFSFAEIVNLLRQCPCVSRAQSSDTADHGVWGAWSDDRSTARIIAFAPMVGERGDRISSMAGVAVKSQGWMADGMLDINFSCSQALQTSRSIFLPKCQSQRPTKLLFTLAATSLSLQHRNLKNLSVSKSVSYALSTPLHTLSTPTHASSTPL
jgi:hypothetical protein